MITIKNNEQISKMREAGALLYEVLQRLCEVVHPGMNTMELDVYAERLIRHHHAVPSFLGYEGFPASLCTSPDDMVVHGIPSDGMVLREGMILSLDCGLVLDGWQADSAITVPVGEVSAEAKRLIALTERCFFEGARRAAVGQRLGDIGYAVSELAEQNGLGVVRDLSGHGIGREMHEDPAVFNYGRPGHGVRLQAGMTLAIEPMITLGTWRVETDDDGWGIRTADRSLCSHYEHTVVINPDGLPEVLTLPGFSWSAYDKGLAEGADLSDKRAKLPGGGAVAASMEAAVPGRGGE